MFYFICYLIMIVILIIYLYLIVKDNKNILEKFIAFILAVVLFVPMFIYYLDLWNIPTYLNLTHNIDTKQWLQFIWDYGATMISTFVATFTSIGIMFYQIKKNNEDIEKRDIENLRIQNMPILKYTIDTYKEVPSDNLLITNVDGDGIKTYNLSIDIKNIGLNSIKQIKIKIEEKELNVNGYLYGNNGIEVLEKGDSVLLQRYFRLEGNNKEYNFKMIFTFQDIIDNWYEQVIDIKYIATNYCCEGKYIGEIDYTICKEKKISIGEK